MCVGGEGHRPARGVLRALLLAEVDSERRVRDLRAPSSALVDDVARRVAWGVVNTTSINGCSSNPSNPHSIIIITSNPLSNEGRGCASDTPAPHLG